MLSPISSNSFFETNHAVCLFNPHCRMKFEAKRSRPAAEGDMVHLHFSNSLFDSLAWYIKTPHLLCQIGIYKTITNVPAPIRIHPINDFAVNSSCKNINASIKVITTLSLSIGTTLEASPICNAL